MKEILVPETSHILYNSDSRKMDKLSDESINLVVTSPPYPMVGMWDDLFKNWDKKTKSALSKNLGNDAFEAMHLQLDKVWKECFRVLKEGGILLVNIGDATRSVGGEFCLFSNHSRILWACRNFGFTSLPDILWRKQTNSPTKFMGSGMFPVGAYVTYEHEYILVFRKGGLRKYSKSEMEIRRNSAFFWEERNIWFSDIWDLKGERQIFKDVGASRERTAAFPVDFAYRLVNMFSIKGDTVLDPFLGTGTTSLAALLSSRNSIGYDLDLGILEIARKKLLSAVNVSSKILQNRLQSHLDFVSNRKKQKKQILHKNKYYGFPVITSQETELTFESVDSSHESEHFSLKARYSRFNLQNSSKK
ncbi:site-specific DNA-methyltransferase [Leptospira sp. WS58.C1]|uniref:DNA-methyltransferase n=1 Tax=Leptospira TaxID=171 RepID=UPI0002BECD9F|nr:MULTISPECIES: site-specific DNA-methyltransferase [unclassified Leptospira]EMJ99527.1 DNA methylase family protein [Leptospira sp. B5-022]MCR1792386.1 site-specific DNA-methyltransferase [Leptospira sp. id769339]